MQAGLDLARAHAPLLVVLTPLWGAVLILLLPAARLGWAIACVVLSVATVIAADLAVRTLLFGATAWAAEGVPLRVDGVGAFATPLIVGVGALSMIASGATLRREWAPRAAPFAIVLTLCGIAAWTGAAFANDLVGFFVAVETAWLASAALVALSPDRAALSGALRMLTAGGVASAFLLLGIGLVYRGAGTLDFAALAVSGPSGHGLAGAGVVLIVTALAVKGGVAPLHAWIGAAYGRAGDAAVLLLGAVGTLGALAVLARVAVAGVAAPAIGEGVAACIAALGVASAIIGSVQAIGARNVRRLVGYAAAAQSGCVLISLALGSPAGIAAALVQALALVASSLALLSGGAAIGGSSLSVFDGAARRAPLASAAMALGALSLMGAPLTLGFLGRWRLIEAAVGGGWWWAAGAAIGASLAAVFFGGRLIERLYFRRAANASEARRDPWRVALAPALIASMAAIALALAPAQLLRVADAAALMMHGEAP